MTFTEREFLTLLHARLGGAPAAAGLRVGPGDDAAVLDAEGREVVVTSDMLLDGVDVVLAECGYARAGRKAMAKSVSDIAAMGVEPWCAFVSVALPAGTTPRDAGELLDGLFAAARAGGAAIAGGDTKRSPGPLAIDVTLLGRAGTPADPFAPVLRSGARPGDRLFVTGALGGAALGRHLDFEPRVREGLLLNRRVRPSAMIDLSDGLAIDLHRLAAASGVGAWLDASRIPISAAARAAAADGRSALEHALGDGEDYELLFALPDARVAALSNDPELRALATEIGACTDERGVTLREEGRERVLEPLGFEHEFGARV